MTRKDYTLIAEAIAAEAGEWRDRPEGLAAIGHAANRIASALRRDNARFYRARFMEACGLASNH